MVLLGTGLIVLLLGVVTNALCPPLAGGSYLSFLILSGAAAASEGIKLIHAKCRYENLISYFDYFFLT
ncbi:MAG: hypothetical protein E6556_01200 [Pantoea sp.]|nr:hypothetical protein [Pantoea sp.]